MKSMFAQILAWFVVTVIVTSIGMGITTAISFEAQQSGRLPPIGRTVTFLLSEARQAYEEGGRPALKAFIDRVEEAYETEAFLTDAKGVDLLTGEDRSAMIEATSRRMTWRRILRNRLLFGTASDEGRYNFVLSVPERRPGLALLWPNLWLIGAAILFCYWLALHLSKPVRELQVTVEQFGRGNLEARTGSTRKDEMGRLARTFDHMAERIQNLLSAERRLLMDVSHELRSPLARLSVAVELARSGDDRDHALDRIQREADRLNALVQQLLQVNRAEADPAARKSDRVDLSGVVKQVVDDEQIEAEQRGCRLQLEPVAPMYVKGDSELLRRAVENIVRNALRYTDPETCVEVRIEERGDNARVTVRDYGPGVPEESLRRIFDPFYRVDSNRDRATGGIGLGLSIARRAVELHGGRIQATNASPGLLVEIELPLQRRPDFISVDK